MSNQFRIPETYSEAHASLRETVERRIRDVMAQREEVLAKLRADPRFNGLHIIAYTAHALPEEKQRLIDAGFDDLLIKPISLKAVELALADFLPA